MNGSLRVFAAQMALSEDAFKKRWCGGAGLVPTARSGGQALQENSMPAAIGCADLESDENVSGPSDRVHDSLVARNSVYI